MRIFVNKIIRLNRLKKQVIMMMIDFILLPLSLLISYSLRFSDVFPLNELIQDKWLFLITPIITIPLFINRGLYRSVLKYMGYQVIIATMKSISIASMILYIVTLLNNSLLPRSIILIFWFVSILTVIGSRYFLKIIVYYSDFNKNPVGIYGAGKAGAQLVDNLRTSSEYYPIALFDDNPSKWGTVVNSLWVYNPKIMAEIIQQNGIKLILVAITTLSEGDRRRILRKIADFPVEVREVTSMENIISGEFSLNHVRRVDVVDILGREPVKPSPNLLKKNILEKNILVTGAGGSIGGELCLQILEQKPNKLILLDHSEYSLYKIHQLLLPIVDIEIIPILTSVTEFEKMLNILSKYNIQTIYHAAAYKHVPMVELNPTDGIRNNIWGTYLCVKAALVHSIETFVLISTDKAVRPTNVMGATKRFSELILQAAQKESIKTSFSMVRFGNVIDSAGSVVPLFREQIKLGGPLTVTHPEVTRYFMSIEEAVQLVIQAGAMAKGGEVFVLDMGNPIKIYNLAEKMIHLSGFEPITSKTPEGQIEIKITGLRPGEKLYEELLIGDNVYITEHPQIMQAYEKLYEWDVIESAAQELYSASQKNDLSKIKNILLQYIEGYIPTENLDFDKVEKEKELLMISKERNNPIKIKGIT